jgi:hypothetical protein
LLDPERSSAENPGRNVDLDNQPALVSLSAMKLGWRRRFDELTHSPARDRSIAAAHV